MIQILYVLLSVLFCLAIYAHGKIAYLKGKMDGFDEAREVMKKAGILK